MNPEIERELKRLSNLKQNKNKTDQEKQKLVVEAQLNIAKRKIKVDERYLDEGEKARAKELFEHYVSTFGFEKFSDLCDLNNLIYEEILLRRIQNHINKVYANDATTYLDKRDREALTDTEDQIEKWKIKLGISQEDASQDELTANQRKEKLFEKYINENKPEFTTACEACGKMLLLRRRVKDFDCMEHTWFAGRWFFNYSILLDVKEGKLSKEDAWRYMCSASKAGTEKISFSQEYCIDYIDYCLDSWDEITENLK